MTVPSGHRDGDRPGCRGRRCLVALSGGPGGNRAFRRSLARARDLAHGLARRARPPRRLCVADRARGLPIGTTRRRPPSTRRLFVVGGSSSRAASRSDPRSPKVCVPRTAPTSARVSSSRSRDRRSPCSWPRSCSARACRRSRPRPSRTGGRGTSPRSETSATAVWTRRRSRPRSMTATMFGAGARSDSRAPSSSTTTRVLRADRTSRLDETPGSTSPPFAAGFRRAADEVALGARTAAERNLDVGDTVGVSGFEVASRRATVTGIVVLPSLGPFQADRTAPGRGILLPEAMVKKSVSFPPPVTFVGVGLDPGRGSHGRAHAGCGTRSGRGTRPATRCCAIRRRSDRPRSSTPARCASHRCSSADCWWSRPRSASRSRSSSRCAARRREMAVLRTLGFTSRQLRVSVRVQALAMMLGGFVVGAADRNRGRPDRVAARSRRSSASRRSTSTPVGWIVVTGIGGAVVAARGGEAGAALPPARDRRLLLRYALE